MSNRLTPEQRKLRDMPEKRLEQYVREIAKKTHWRRYHTYRSERSPAGFPDECYVRPPLLMFAELKREGAEPTPEQVFWLNDLSLCTPYVFLWKPRDLESGEIAKLLSDPEKFIGTALSRWVAS